MALHASILSAQPGRWTPGPGLSGDPHWRPPVATAAALPTTGNQLGDARLDLSTFALYVWDGNSWELPPAGSGPPSGPAGGVLSGSYPNPGIASDAIPLGTATTGGYAASATEGGPATTALAFAADPADCGAGQMQVGSEADGDAICAPEPAGVTDHGLLTGRDDDDHPGNAWLAGRPGTGQILYGSNTTGGNLYLRSTSHATKGAVIADSTLQVPNGSSSALGWAFAGETTTGAYRREPGKINFVFQGTNSLLMAYNVITVERSDGRICFGDPDVCVQRTAAGEVSVTNASSGKGTLFAEILKLNPRTSAPTCSTPAFYVNSTSSNTLCYCNGSTWSAVSGPGPC